MKIYEAQNHILIHTDSISPSGHRHMAAHIMVSLDNNIKVYCDDEYCCKGILIPADTYHEVDIVGNNTIVFLYECSSDVAKQINDVRIISDDLCQKIKEAYLNLENVTDYKRFETSCLDILELEYSNKGELDNRIKTALEYIHHNICEKLTCKDVADKVFLSQSRFSHLFKEQIGMTFSAYVVYQRLMYVYAKVIAGISITQAALDAGFSSSGHFADVSRRVFGLSATVVTQDIIFEKTY